MEAAYCFSRSPTASAISFPVSASRRRSGEDLRLLAGELISRDDSPVAEVSQLRQLIRRISRRARPLLDMAAVGLVLTLSTPRVHLCAAGDLVDQDADQRDEQHEQEPQSLGAAGQVVTAEDVHENHD